LRTAETITARKANLANIGTTPPFGAAFAYTNISPVGAAIPHASSGSDPVKSGCGRKDTP